MKTKKHTSVIPDAAMLDRTEYVTAALDKKGFVERTLKEANSSFGRTLNQTTEDVSSLQSAAGTAARKMAEGKKVNVHEMIAAVEKARNSYDQLVDIRNKMIEAYREFLRKRT